MINRILLAAVSAMLIASCAPMQPAQARGDYYQRGCENCGRIIRIESLGNRDNSLGGGAVIGAIVGGALGNQVGKGDGRTAATIAGAVAGGAIGHSVEKDNRRSQSYYRIVVRMDRGQTYSFEQPGRYDFRRGDRVYIDNGVVVPGR